MWEGLSRRDWFRSLLGLAAGAAVPPGADAAAAPSAGPSARAAVPALTYGGVSVTTYTYEGGRLVSIEPPPSRLAGPAWATHPVTGCVTYVYDAGG
jgi:hypothetical protein